MTTTSSANADLAAADANSRLYFLAEVSEMLWPAPLRAGLDVESGAVVSEFVIVPNVRRPRLLVPAGHRRAAAAALRCHTEPGSAKRRLLLRALSAALATGLGGVAMRHRFRVCADGSGHVANSIETYLRGVLDADLTISVALGPAKANRKPVLQLLTPAGETIGFAKLGFNDLTRTLARAERDSLLTLEAASLRHITPPGVAHHGQWNGLEVLVQTPLPVWKPRVPPGPERLTAAMLEIAGLGENAEGPLRDSPYWASLGDRITALAEKALTLRAAYARIAEYARDTRLRFGSWHGDWTPWNMATLRDTLLVWDWERFTSGVPLGFDALHYAFQGAVVRQGTDPAVAMTETVHRAAELLAPFGVGGRSARVTALLYFTDIAVRYLHDEQAEAGARLGRLDEWLLPALIDQVERLRVG